MRTYQDKQPLFTLKNDGEDLKREFMKSALSREKLVSLVQDDGLSFSYAGLDRMFRGELPKKDSDKIISSCANHLGCSWSLFAEEIRQTA